MRADPFDGDGVWLRCALHAHSTESDGDLAPRALMAAYEAAGFDVLAVTDHWRLTSVPSTPALLSLPAAELTADVEKPGMTADVLVYGIEAVPDDPGGDRRNWMVNEEEHWEQRTFASISCAAAYAREQGAVAFVAHPYWTGLDAAPILDAEGVAGLEVYNASGETECGRGDSSMVWDAALERGRTLFGIATDDTHVARLDVGRAWTHVRAADRSPDAVVAALREGRFYASAGPTLHHVHRDGAAIEVRCSPCRAVVLQMEREHGCSVVAGPRGRRDGRILETDGEGLITRAVVESPWAAPRFVRVRAVDAEGQSAWTNAL